MQTPEQPKNVAQTRRLTICRKAIERFGQQHCVQFPILSLCGKWLRDSGFKIDGQPNDIMLSRGCPNMGKNSELYPL